MQVRRNHAEYNDLGDLYQDSETHEPHGRSDSPLLPFWYIRDLTDDPPRVTSQDYITDEGVEGCAKVKPSGDVHWDTPTGQMLKVEPGVADIQPCQDEEDQVETIGQHHDHPQESFALSSGRQAKKSNGECCLAQSDRTVHEAHGGEVDCLSMGASVENIEAVCRASCTEAIRH